MHMSDIQARFQILSGKNSLEELIFYLKNKDNRISGIFVLTDLNTRKHCYPRLFKKLHQNQILHDVISIQPGEASKSLETCDYLWNWLIKKNADRSSLLINLGGGMISDVGGFVSAVFKRGMRFVNIPTSLMGQVDASLGGKTGINFKGFKNQLGSFTPPEFVVIDPVFLSSLPQREYCSAFPELMKYALISRPAWIELLDSEFPESISFSMGNMPDLEKLMERSVNCKMDFVKGDLIDQNRRKALNAGHTIGHAMESYFANSKEMQLLHGEAVGIGLIVELYVSYKMYGFPGKLLSAVANSIISRTGKFDIPMDIDLFMEQLVEDKKNFEGKILFSLLKEPGVVIFDQEVDTALLSEGLKFYNSFPDAQLC